MLRLCLILGLIVLNTGGCTGSEQVKVKTRAAQVGQTAIVEAQQAVETKAAQLKATAICALATELAKQSQTQWTIGLDPGHGWSDAPGAASQTMKEKDVNLDVALRAKRLLEERGFVVVMTRTADEPAKSLDEAARVVNAAQVDLVVSIHANAGGGTGAEACYTVGKSTDNQSKALAQLLVDLTGDRLSLTKRGVFPENAEDRCARRKATGWTQLYIHDMDMPAALIEMAFIDSAHDAELLMNRREDFAQAIVDAITAYTRVH